MQLCLVTLQADFLNINQPMTTQLDTEFDAKTKNTCHSTPYDIFLTPASISQGIHFNYVQASGIRA